MNKKVFSGFQLFGKAYRATRHEIGVSLKMLFIVTLCFAVLLYLAESAVNADYTFWDALVWTFVKYVEDPADISSPPVTIIGQIIGTLVGVLGIAIFAVPAGLIGSGLTDAMAEEKREQELENFHHRILKAFRRSSNKTLRAYLNSLPDRGGEALSKLNFVPQSIPVAQLQLRQGMDLKDIFETCNEFPGLRLNNLATAKSDEDNTNDSFVVEHFPINRSYGCCINRGSNVTIVSPSGVTEIGVSWYTYYLAKLGGFNLISKDVEVDTDEIDSFYNMSPKPLYDKKTREEYTSKDKEIIAVIDRKERCRKDFLQDIKDVNRGKDSWVIIVTPHQKNSTNKTDFHFAYTKKNGANPTLSDEEKYREFYQEFSSLMHNEFQLSSEDKSLRYPLLKNNLAYRMIENGIYSNAFVMRLSTDLINFDSNRLVIALQMAQVISSQFDNNRGIHPDDIKDLASTGFGYVENK
jgi:voltage-gated potassium channel